MCDHAGGGERAVVGVAIEDRWPYDSLVSFSDIASEVYGLYREGRFPDALAVVVEARPRHASEDATLTFWEGCLLSVSGNPSGALAALQHGVSRGLWWSETMLGDSDLDQVRVFDGWSDFLEECERRAKRVAGSRPEVFARPPVPPEAGVLVTLHGAHADPAEHARVWEAAAPVEWMVITPVGTVPATVNRWSWPSTTVDSIAGVLDQLPSLDWDRRVVLGGFSQGGRVALSLAERSPRPPEGLVLVAPAVQADALPPVPDVPTFFIVGERDWALPGVEALARVMTERGVPHVLDRRAGMDHVVPEDFGVVLPNALNWLSTTPAV